MDSSPKQSNELDSFPEPSGQMRLVDTSVVSHWQRLVSEQRWQRRRRGSYGLTSDSGEEQSERHDQKALTVASEDGEVLFYMQGRRSDFAQVYGTIHMMMFTWQGYILSYECSIPSPECRLGDYN